MVVGGVRGFAPSTSAVPLEGPREGRGGGTGEGGECVGNQWPAHPQFPPPTLGLSLCRDWRGGGPGIKRSSRGGALSWPRDLRRVRCPLRRKGLRSGWQGAAGRPGALAGSRRDPGVQPHAGPRPRAARAASPAPIPAELGKPVGVELGGRRRDGVGVGGVGGNVSARACAGSCGPRPGSRTSWPAFPPRQAPARRSPPTPAAPPRRAAAGKRRAGIGRPAAEERGGRGGLGSEVRGAVGAMGRSGRRRARRRPV